MPEPATLCAVIAAELHAQVENAERSGDSLRLHFRDGEVAVVRVLGYEDDRLVYAPITSSRPERYAVCDSTGFIAEYAKLERISVPKRRGTHA